MQYFCLLVRCINESSNVNWRKYDKNSLIRHLISYCSTLNPKNRLYHYPVHPLVFLSLKARMKQQSILFIAISHPTHVWLPHILLRFTNILNLTQIIMGPFDTIWNSAKSDWQLNVNKHRIAQRNCDNFVVINR